MTSWKSFKLRQRTSRKQFNIVRVEPQKKKVVEIDLFDSDDDEDEEEYRQNKSDRVAEAGYKDINWDEEIVALIVGKDLKSLGGNKPSAFTETDKNHDDGSDIVLLD